MSDLFETLFQNLSQDMFTVINLRVDITPTGIMIKCGGSKAARDSFSKELGKDTYELLSAEFEAVAARAGEIITSNGKSAMMIDLLELEKQAEAVKSGEDAEV